MMRTVADQSEPLRIWVVYFNTIELPGLYVVREQSVVGSAIVVAAMARSAPTLEGVRKFIPPGLHRMDPFPEDGPGIVETWF